MCHSPHQQQNLSLKQLCFLCKNQMPGRLASGSARCELVRCGGRRGILTWVGLGIAQGEDIGARGGEQAPGALPAKLNLGHLNQANSPQKCRSAFFQPWKELRCEDTFLCDIKGTAPEYRCSMRCFFLFLLLKLRDSRTKPWWGKQGLFWWVGIFY